VSDCARILTVAHEKWTGILPLGTMVILASGCFWLKKGTEDRMDKILALPVVNGVFPRPNEGRIRGVFFHHHVGRVFRLGERGHPVLLCPFVTDLGQIYPLGVLVEVRRVWTEEVFAPDRETRVLAPFVEVVGRGRARARGFSLTNGVLIAEGVEMVDLDKIRNRGYPVIDGAGWQAVAGTTEMTGPGDVYMEIEGIDLDSRERLKIGAKVGDLVAGEQAHTLEHALIRSLNQFALATPKTVLACWRTEADELKRSVDWGFRYRRPELFGVTSSGACGNPLTDLAHFYLSREMLKSLKRGQSWWESLEEARSRTLSRLVSHLEITTEAGLRILQGLKKGMYHDDQAVRYRTVREALRRFPADPWRV